MLEFQIYTLLIAAICLWGMWWAIFVRRDVFHPLAYLMPMASYLYVYLPYTLFSKGLIALVTFTPWQWAHAQLVNLFCIGALTIGAVLGSREKPKKSGGKIYFRPRDISRAYTFALVLGGASLLAYSVNLNNVGGFIEAYSREKGGGTAESGYVRDAIFWCVPAIALLGFCISWDQVRVKYVLPMLLFAMPLMMHGLLGARRGPTFIIIVTLVATWFLARRKRPPILLFLGGGAALGFLLLLIVTFRGDFRLGGEVAKDTGKPAGSLIEQMEERQIEGAERNLGGNEFVYGANVILTFAERADYFWGKRLLTIMFIRPIPKELWRTKYLDVGMERYLANVGLGTGEDMVMWTTYGAAPGFVADLFAEFSYAAIFFAGLIGWVYARIWRVAVSQRGLGMIVYVILFAFSIFLILQTMEAIVFRFLFTTVLLFAFWYFKMPRRQAKRKANRPSGNMITARASSIASFANRIAETPE